MYGFNIENVGEGGNGIRTAMPTAGFSSKGGEDLEAVVGCFPRVLVDKALYRGPCTCTLLEKHFDGIDDEPWPANIPIRVVWKEI